VLLMNCRDLPCAQGSLATPVVTGFSLCGLKTEVKTWGLLPPNDMRSRKCRDEHFVVDLTPDKLTYNSYLTKRTTAKLFEPLSSSYR
jgi:hypothetical protein